jgi:hypothetical protein
LAYYIKKKNSPSSKEADQIQAHLGNSGHPV